MWLSRSETRDRQSSTDEESGYLSKDFVPPKVKASAFSCPQCGAYSHQIWLEVHFCYPGSGSLSSLAPSEQWYSTLVEKQAAAYAAAGVDITSGSPLLMMAATAGRGGRQAEEILLDVSECAHCNQRAYWYRQKLVVPEQLTTPPPVPDMPDSVKADFEEARAIFSHSPRSSAALLRLAIQKLCIHLGQPGNNLNEDIGSLVDGRLPERVQKALDIVRVIGNNQVHPGTIDVRDDPESATMLFSLVNLIVDTLITAPARIDMVFDKLPAGAKEQIARRDGKKRTTE